MTGLLEESLEDELKDLTEVNGAAKNVVEQFKKFEIFPKGIVLVNYENNKTHRAFKEALEEELLKENYHIEITLDSNKADYIIDVRAFLGVYKSIKNKKR